MRFIERLPSHSMKVLLPLYLMIPVILSGVFVVSPLYAQGDSALWGIVTDASSSAVPGATVTITNLETGTKRELATDESGQYSAPALPVGHYEIAASKSGFRTAPR